jgi:hypothetical protein
MDRIILPACPNAYYHDRSRSRAGPIAARCAAVKAAPPTFELPTLDATLGIETPAPSRNRRTRPTRARILQRRATLIAASMFVVAGMGHAKARACWRYGPQYYWEGPQVGLWRWSVKVGFWRNRTIQAACVLCGRIPDEFRGCNAFETSQLRRDRRKCGSWR